MKRLQNFLRAEDGAITVDWVALTAIVIGIGMAASFFVASSVPSVANKLNTYMSEVDVGE